MFEGMAKALRVDERAARVAAVDGGVGLQKVLEAPVGESGRATLRGDDSRSDGLPDAERVADCQDHVADARLVRVAQSEDGQARRLDLQDGEV
jgi:hypothetical protein